MCTLSIRDSYAKYAVYNWVANTEVIDNNLNPKWIKHFTVWWVFVKDIDLLFQVFNYNDQSSQDLIGEVEISLSKLMLQPEQTMKLKLVLPESKSGTRKIRNRNNRGTLIVRADKIKKTEDIIKYQISADLKSQKFLCFGKDDPYLVIERARQNVLNDMVIVFRTQTAYDQINPWWEPNTLSMTEFCNNNKLLPLKISVKCDQNYGVHKIYGSVEITTRGIEMAGLQSLELKNAKGKVTGTITFN